MHSLKYPSYALVAVLAAFTASPARADDNLPAIQRQGNISYLSGGIGKEESDALEAVQRQYNLRIMSADTSGHFSSNTHIVINDLHHHALLDTTGGPLFYANLPNGRYTVEGSSEGHSKKQTITIAGGKPAHVHFSWQQHVADADTATPHNSF